MNDKIPKEIQNQAMEWVMQQEIAKLSAENRQIRAEITEIDEIEREAGE